MDVEIRAFEIGDYDEVAALWARSEGIVLRAADGREAVARYLARNPGLSLVARDAEGRCIGAALCGHDGRRGYLQHVAVARDWRGRGIGRALVERCLEALAAEGILKCHLMVVKENRLAMQFWRRVGWAVRDDIVLMSRTAPGAAGA